MEQLKEEQKIIFTIKNNKYEYKVKSNFLQRIGCHFNDEIFLDLKIDKIKLATSAYGYDSYGGDWPVCKHKDFSALTRLVEALFPYCDEVTLDGKVVYSKSEKTIFKEPESSISSSKLESSDIIDFESIVKSQTIKLTFI